MPVLYKANVEFFSWNLSADTFGRLVIWIASCRLGLRATTDENIDKSSRRLMGHVIFQTPTRTAQYYSSQLVILLETYIDGLQICGR